MNGELAPDGPTDSFLKFAGKSPSEFRAELTNWNPAAIALFLAEFAYQEAHDTTLNAFVDSAIHDDDKLGEVQRPLKDMPGTSAGNEAIDMLR